MVDHEPKEDSKNHSFEFDGDIFDEDPQVGSILRSGAEIARLIDMSPEEIEAKYFPPQDNLK